MVEQSDGASSTLKRVPINPNIIRVVNELLYIHWPNFTNQLILDKNAQYGDSWQAEGPFVAAGRMKDKMIRVETLASQSGDYRQVSQTTTPEIVQDVIEMMMYAQMLLMYLAYNEIGLFGTEPLAIKQFYYDLESVMAED